MAHNRGFQKIRMKENPGNPMVETEGDIYRRNYRKRGRVQELWERMGEAAKAARMSKGMAKWHAPGAGTERDMPTYRPRKRYDPQEY